jgi:hypothetical protein
MVKAQLSVGRVPVKVSANVLELSLQEMRSWIRSRQATPSFTYSINMNNDSLDDSVYLFHSLKPLLEASSRDLYCLSESTSRNKRPALAD